MTDNSFGGPPEDASSSSMGAADFFASQTDAPVFFNENDDAERLSSLSIRQEKVLSLLGIFSATLSILGSFTIVYKVLKHRKTKANTPYDRLMLGLSTCDIVASLSFALSPFLLPQETSQRVWAVGNDFSCSILLGWMTQFGFAAVVYNGVLSFYYLLTVRYGVKRKVFAQRYEPWLHGTIWIFFVGTATMGAIIGLFNELEFGCWANNYPEGCVDDECSSRFFGWVIGAIPTFLTLIALTVNNIVIFCHVQKTLKVTVTENAPTSTTAVQQEQPPMQQQPFTMSHEALQQHQQQTQQEQREVRHAIQIREVATQGFLYVGSFLLCYTPAIVVRVLESLLFTYEDEADIYVWLFLNAFLLPMQGFFNWIIYHRPSYIRVRAAHPEQSRGWTFYYCIFNTDIPKWTEIDNLTTTASSGWGNNNHRSKKSSSGKAYSGDLPSVPEDSAIGGDGTNHGDGDDFKDDEDYDSGPLYKGPSFRIPNSPRTSNNVTSESSMNTSSSSLQNNDHSERLSVFGDATTKNENTQIPASAVPLPPHSHSPSRSPRRIGMDGSMHSNSNKNEAC